MYATYMENKNNFFLNIYKLQNLLNQYDVCSTTNKYVLNSGRVRNNTSFHLRYAEGQVYLEESAITSPKPCHHLLLSSPSIALDRMARHSLSDCPSQYLVQCKGHQNKSPFASIDANCDTGKELIRKSSSLSSKILWKQLSAVPL